MNLEQKIKSHIRDIPDFPKPGIIFKDITPILAMPNLCKEIISYFVSTLSNQQIDAVIGIESRGFIFGMALAQALNTPFIPVRKKGKLPYKTFTQSYDLEYGSAEIEIHTDAISPKSKVLIHDDLLATGGTACATAELIKKFNAQIAGFCFLVNLEFLNGETNLQKYSSNIISVVKY